MSTGVLQTTLLPGKYISHIDNVQPLPWDSKDKAIFAMLDDICIANKQNPLSMSSNMATVT